MTNDKDLLKKYGMKTEFHNWMKSQKKRDKWFTIGSDVKFIKRYDEIIPKGFLGTVFEDTGVVGVRVPTVLGLKVVILHEPRKYIIKV